MIRISIIVPTYNRERCLVDRLKQAMGQRPPADEIVVVDQSRRHEPETESFLEEHARAGRIQPGFRSA